LALEDGTDRLSENASN